MIDDFCEIELKYVMISSSASVMQLYFYFLKPEVYISWNLLQLIRAPLNYHLILILFLNACLTLKKKFSPLHNMM